MWDRHDMAALQVALVQRASFPRQQQITRLLQQYTKERTYSALGQAVEPDARYRTCAR